MKVAILSRRPALDSTERLRAAALRRGHDVRVIDYLRCYMDITAHRPVVVFRGERLDDLDAIVPRIAARHTFYGTAVVRQFEVMGVSTANGSQPIARARDLLRCLQLLAREGIGLPVTAFANSVKDVGGVIDIVGGAPLVIKALEGLHGVSTVMAENRGAAESVFHAFRDVDTNILVQELIRDTKGASVRALVVGGKVVSAVRRAGPPGEARPRAGQAIVTEPVKLTPEERSTAARAVKALGLQVAGIDLLRAPHGPVVSEVTPTPKLEGLEGAGGRDPAEAIIELLEHEVASGNGARKPQF